MKFVYPIAIAEEVFRWEREAQIALVDRLLEKVRENLLRYLEEGVSEVD